MERAAFIFAVLVGLTVAQNYPPNATMIIRDYGYPCDEHLALTSDGYYLLLLRIPHGRTNPNQPTKGVVLFQHGLTDSCNGIVLNPPDESLAFIMADAGYDVWIGNNRGNGYSMTNKYYQNTQPEFWDFSFDEMASIDLPTEIDYILSATGKSKISYIGHSEGTTQAFAGFLNPSTASKVNVFIALAPVATVGNTPSIVLHLLADLHAEDIFEILGETEFDLPSAVEKLLPNFCTLFPELCNSVVDALDGPEGFLNETRLPYYANYEPDPTSVKNMVHWSQAVRSGLFQQFDYGPSGNMQHYGQITPPLYDLSLWPANLPIAMFAGGIDALADPTDVKNLLATLSGFSPYFNNQPDYGHLDFVIGYNANIRIYPQVLQLLSQYN